VRVLIWAGAGGMYGIYSRLMDQYMPKYIPGHPNMINQFMPGAGGVKAANYFMNAAPRDGSMIAMLSQAVALTQMMPAGTRIEYDASKMHWIGSFDTVTNVLSVWNAHTPIRTFADLKTHELIVGASGKGSIGDINMILTKKLLGAKLKIISGYNKMEDIDLAFERGELTGRAATFISITSRKMDWITGHKITNVIQYALRPHPDFKNVPLAQDLTNDPEAKNMFRFIASPSTIGRAIALPPGTPADRVAAIREAFEKTVHDPAFLKDAHARGLPIDYVSAPELDAAIKETVSAPKALVDKVSKLTAHD
jgi:tripartite-type tricarboxylate transporter receptor subunit TctC